MSELDPLWQTLIVCVSRVYLVKDVLSCLSVLHAYLHATPVHLK